MWAWAALLGGLAIVIAADLVSGPPRAARGDVGRTGNETMLDARDQRALALARNFAAWHQAATSVVQGTPLPSSETPIPDGQIRGVLPTYYNKAGAWRSTVGPQGVRTSDDGTVTVAGITIGGGAFGRFIAAATGYAGLGGLQIDQNIAITNFDAAGNITTTIASGHGIRMSLPDAQLDSSNRDANAP